jgi:hypothetical protein
VTHEGPAGGIVHRVGHVTHEHDVLAVLRHLPQPEGAARDAHVEMHAHEDDVVDVLRLEQVPDLHAAVADGVLFLVDAQRVDLLRPRALSDSGPWLRVPWPRRRVRRIVVLAAVGLIERIHRQFLGGICLHHSPILSGKRGRGRRGLRALACRRAFVGLHAGAAGRVDDEHAGFAGLFEHLVHARGHLALACDRVFAVMQVPHVADDDGGAGGQPLFLGGVRRASEYGDKTQCCEQGDGLVQKHTERMAHRGANEKQWRDFTAFESRSESHGGVESFPQPTP